MTTGARPPRECDAEANSQSRQLTSAKGPLRERAAHRRHDYPDERTLIQQMEAVPAVLD
jgi:hypothetical protein